MLFCPLNVSACTKYVLKMWMSTQSMYLKCDSVEFSEGGMDGKYSALFSGNIII